MFYNKMLKWWNANTGSKRKWIRRHWSTLLVGLSGGLSLILMANSHWMYGSYEDMFMRSIQKLEDEVVLEVSGTIRVSDKYGDSGYPFEFYYEGYLDTGNAECDVDLFLPETGQVDDILVGQILFSGDDNTLSLSIMGNDVVIPAELNVEGVAEPGALEAIVGAVEVSRKRIADIRPGFGHMKRSLVCYSYTAGGMAVEAYVDSRANLICVTFNMTLGQMQLEGDVIL